MSSAVRFPTSSALSKIAADDILIFSLFFGDNQTDISCECHSHEMSAWLSQKDREKSKWHSHEMSAWLSQKIKISSAAILEEVSRAQIHCWCAGCYDHLGRHFSLFAGGTLFTRTRSLASHVIGVSRHKPVNKWFGVKEAHARHRPTPFRSKTNAAIVYENRTILWTGFRRQTGAELYGDRVDIVWKSCSLCTEIVPSPSSFRMEAARRWYGDSAKSCCMMGIRVPNVFNFTFLLVLKLLK